MDNNRQGGGNFRNYDNKKQYNNNYNNNNSNYNKNQGYQNNYSNNYSNNTGEVSNYQPQLKNINFELTDIYFPLFVLQMRFDIFPLRNRSLRQNYQGQSDSIQRYILIFNLKFICRDNQSHLQAQGYEEIAEDDDYALLNEYQRQFYETNNKIFFILRDQFLLTKIQITGTLVFIIKKEEKYIFGIDDSTGVMVCVLWLNDFNNQGGNAGKRNSDFRTWFSEKNIQLGSVLAVLGSMEHYKDKIQVNVHKLRNITDISEEMLQYQQTINAQKCYFDPFKPFQRRLFNANWQQEQQQQFLLQQQENKKNQQNDPAADQEMAAGNEVYKFSINRIKKKINDYILNNYNELFQNVKNQSNNDQQIKKDSLEDSEMDSPSKPNTNTKAYQLPIDNQNLSVTELDFLENPKLLQKIGQELAFSDDPNKKPTELLRECLAELEEKGFVNLVGETAKYYMIQIRDQRKKLKYFIQNEMKNQRRGVHFETIYKDVCKQYDNFYTKEFVFKVIDELFQMGVIYEVAKLQYGYLDNQF
ncbi:UNKNOWN [Stylonychia lemnae]|uniref:CST complex subunit STN1 n=1 Tax=Stylonychia lemnae TaxID=5949 RepID=A0A077ZVU6_STYLE|nr:UNKNOWN [Stylonychia lemnae]|eukprot:CDW74075.1 UNKNOWN [Stylonychia lemnae]